MSISPPFQVISFRVRSEARVSSINAPSLHACTNYAADSRVNCQPSKKHEPCVPVHLFF